MSILQVDTIKDTSGNLNPTITRATAQVTTSGTQFDFTGIPAGVKRITVMFDAVSLTGTDDLLIQIGTSGGVVTSGYDSTSEVNGTPISHTDGFAVKANDAAVGVSGHMVLSNISGTRWTESHSVHRRSASSASHGGGDVDLSGTLTQVRVTRSGSNTFDGGQVNIIYE